MTYDHFFSAALTRLHQERRYRVGRRLAEARFAVQRTRARGGVMVAGPQPLQRPSLFR